MMGSLRDRFAGILVALRGLSPVVTRRRHEREVHELADEYADLNRRLRNLEDGLEEARTTQLRDHVQVAKAVADTTDYAPVEVLEITDYDRDRLGDRFRKIYDAPTEDDAKTLAEIAGDGEEADT